MKQFYTFKKQKKLRFLVAVFVIILAMWIYYFPLQRVFAEKEYLRYAAQQGVAAADIKSKEVYKDYTQGGYYITVQYNSDPSNVYSYQYFLIERRTDGIALNRMYCYIFDLQNNQLDDLTGAVYQPIEANL